MPNKGKLPVEKKVRIVCEYLSGSSGAREIERKYAVCWDTLREWVRLYKVSGSEGLTPSARYERAGVEKKVTAVQAYLNGSGSLRDICTYDGGDISVRFKFADEYRRVAEYIEANTPKAAV